MAIYNVDAINEQELAAERDDILDNMLEACDNMLTALDESKARRRYVAALYKKVSDHEDNACNYASIAADFEKLKNDKKAEEYARKADKEMHNAKSIEKDAERYYGHNETSNRDAERRFKRDFNTYPTKTDREPGIYKSIQDKKRAIKETCLTILSALDEI